MRGAGIPSDFQRQGELYVPAMRASPKDAPAHTAEIIQLLPKLIDAAAPGHFGAVHLAQADAGSPRRPAGRAGRLLLLVQGSLPKAVLLARYHERLAAQQASVIFGLDSFAEGLDLPGKPACR